MTTSAERIAGLDAYSKELHALVPDAVGAYGTLSRAAQKPGALDRKTKELIAIAASLASHCHGCLKGHIKKAMKYGATREELSETIAITMGVAAAAIVDLTDIAAAEMQIKNFEPGPAQVEPREVSPEE